MKNVNNFKYLGGVVKGSGGMDNGIRHRVSAAWATWKKCSGVLCERKMPLMVKGKIYRTVVKGSIGCMVQRHGQQRKAKKGDRMR